MKKNVKNYEVSEEGVRGLKNQNTTLKRVVLIQSIIIIILLILWICALNKISQLKDENEKLRNENIELKCEIILLEDRIESCKEVDSLNSVIISLLRERNAELKSEKSACEKTMHVLRNELANLRKEIYRLMLKVDSLQNLPVREIKIDTCMTEETEVIDTTKVYSKNLKVSMIKKTFTKKGNVLSQDTIFVNNAPVYYTPQGFVPDALIGNYNYHNKKGDEMRIGLNSLITKDNISLTFTEKNQNSGAEEFLVNKNTGVKVGSGGILITEEGKPIDACYVHKFLERTSNPKKGLNWKCIAGPIATGAGAGGLAYFLTNPIVTVKVNQGNNLIAEDKTYNVPMIITSAAVTLTGIVLTIKGCRCIVTPAGIYMRYNLQ